MWSALRAEINATATVWPWTPETVYLGGGTPSQMDPSVLAAILADDSRAAVERRRPWKLRRVAITQDKAEAWRNAGINRVSLGVQSFMPRELARTGRKHTAEIVEREMRVLRAAGISNFNIDLIAGLPGQTPQAGTSRWIGSSGSSRRTFRFTCWRWTEDSRLGAEILALGKRYGAAEVPVGGRDRRFLRNRGGASGRRWESRATRFRTSPAPASSRATT